MFFDNPFDFNGDDVMSLWEQDMEYAAFRSVMEDDFDESDEFDEEEDY